MAPRSIRTAARIEGARETAALAATLGGELRAQRRAKRWTLRRLASRVGLSVTRCSEIEPGLGSGASLETWIALGISLGRPLAVRLTRAIGAEVDLRDAGHLEIQEFLLGLARATGRHGTFELPSRPTDPSRSTDVGIRDDANRAAIQVECWNTFGDLGAAVRATDRKHREAADLMTATQRDASQPHRVASVWVVRATAANRALLARYPQILRSAFSGPSRAWVRALTTPVAPPQARGLVWFDPATRRLMEWRSRPRQVTGEVFRPDQRSLP